jgi:hypothetical protein
MVTLRALFWLCVYKITVGCFLTLLELMVVPVDI